MRRRLVTILLLIVASVTLGYTFFLSWLLGFAACRHLASRSVGERGKVRSIVIPFRRRKIHLHHWLCCLCGIGLTCVTGIHLLTPTVTCGLLGGLIFQGIYCYSDWNRILISRHQTTARDRWAQPGELSVCDKGWAGVLSIERLGGAASHFPNLTHTKWPELSRQSWSSRQALNKRWECAVHRTWWSGEILKHLTRLTSMGKTL